MTVAELRLALNFMEQGWSAQDLEVLGEFRDQGIFVDTIGSDGRYAGIGMPGPAYFDARFGVMLLAVEPQRKENA